MEELTGKRFGQYQLLEPLGEGGMAVVYKAFQPAMERHVALKILPRHYADDVQFIQRFRQEAQIIAQFQHPHILPVFDYGEAEGYTYLVMPYVESGTLTELMSESALTLVQIRRIMTQVGDALDYAHSHGVVHRDVKPSNILIDERGNCLLTDFGIAKIIQSTAQLTVTGSVIGTPAYMSPEQITGKSLDGRSDIYSLGIVLYEMATGRPPFRAETPPALFVKHLHDPLPPPRTFKPDIPERLETVILKALAKEPRNRYRDAESLVRAIREAIPADSSPEAESMPVDPAETVSADELLRRVSGAAAATEEPAIEAGREAVKGQRSRRPWLWVGIITLVAAALGLTLVFSGGLARDGATTEANGRPGAAEAAYPATAEPTSRNQEAMPRRTETATPAGSSATQAPTPTTVESVASATAERTEDAVVSAAAAPGTVLFEDDFESGGMGKWDEVGPGFSVAQDETGNFVLELRPSQSTHAVLGHPSWRDYAWEFRARVIVPSGSRDIWVHPRHNQALTNCTPYAVWIAAEASPNAVLGRETGFQPNCEEVLLDTVVNMDLALERWYAFRIVAVGTKLSVFVDEQLLLQATDEAHPEGGRIYISKPETGIIQYDDMRVIQLDQQLVGATSANSEGAILFEDGFESGFAENWADVNDGFTVLEDETGNFVLEADGSRWSEASAGDSSWRDYVFEFDARILESNIGSDGPAEVGPIVRDTAISRQCQGYHVIFNVGPSRGASIGHETPPDSECNDAPLDSNINVSLELNRWYGFRIEAAGSKIAVFLDGEPVLHVVDNEPLLSGGIVLVNVPGVRKQFDNIRVTEIRPEAADAFLAKAVESATGEYASTDLLEAVGTAASEEPTIADDFSDPKSSGFQMVEESGSSVRFDDGGLLFESYLQGPSYFGTGHDRLTQLTDVIIQLDVRFESQEEILDPSGRIHLRTSPSGQYEVVVYSDDGELYSQVSFESSDQLIEPEPAAHGTYDGTWRNLIVVLVGNRLSYFLDGELVFTAEQAMSAMGGFSIDAIAGTKMWIDNFRMWDVAYLDLSTYAATLDECPTPGAGVTPRSRPAILFDEAHGNGLASTAEGARAIDQRPELFFDASMLIGTFESRGYAVESMMDGLFTADLLANFDLLLVPAPVEFLVGYDACEVNAILEFVNGGGGLLILGDGAQDASINRLLVRIGALMWRQPILAAEVGEDGLFENFWVREMGEHPATEGVSRWWFNHGTAIRIFDEAWSVLMTTPAETWLDRDLDGMQRPDEPTGPFVAGAAREYGRGRLVVYSDNNVFDVYDPEFTLYNSMVRWAAGDPSRGSEGE